MLVVTLGLAPTPGAAQEVDLSGVYLCEGYNPDGSPYRGTVQIARQDETYRLKWTISNRDTALGVGILRGDVLAVTFFGGPTVGVVVYRVADDRLTGEWTGLGVDGHVYKETLSKLEIVSPQGTPLPPAAPPRPRRAA